MTKRSAITRAATLIYVHGAGDQPAEADWRRIHDALLFPGDDDPPTDMAYYADLVSNPGGSPSDAISAADADASRDDADAIRDASPDADASDTVLAGLIHHSVVAERQDRAHRFLRRLASAMTPLEHPSPTALPASIVSPTVRHFYREVSGYLHGEPDLAEAIRERVRASLRRQHGPVVLLAHSLGSIISFDVLGEPEFAGREITLLTAGTPLGLGPAQDHLRAWRGSRPIGLPPGVRLWRNFHASGDPIAHGSHLEGLRGTFAPAGQIHATLVRNDEEWHHALSGYLQTIEVQDAVQARVCWAGTPRGRLPPAVTESS